MNSNLRFVPRTDVDTVEIFVEDVYVGDMTKYGEPLTINNVTLSIDNLEAIVAKAKELKRIKEAKK